MITPLEARIMRFLRQHLAENEASPSLRDIGEAVGVSSRGTVNRYIHRLIDKGYLVAADDSRRSLRLTDPADELTLPFLGRVAAGKPIEAIEDRQQLNLSQLLGGNDRFVLEVKGESMINAGIMPNDLVILQRAQQAQNGDVVLALIDDNEATLKRIKFHHNNKKVELIPENDDMNPVHYKAEQVQIQGVLAGVVRSYK